MALRERNAKIDGYQKEKRGYNCKLESQSVSTMEKISNLFIGQNEMAGQDFVVEIVCYQ